MTSSFDTILELYPNLNFYAENSNGDIIYPFYDNNCETLFLILTSFNPGTPEYSGLNTINLNQNTNSPTISKVFINCLESTELNIINIGTGGGGGEGGYFNSGSDIIDFFIGTGGGGGSGGQYDIKNINLNIGNYTATYTAYMGGEGAGQPLTITSDGDSGFYGGQNNFNNNSGLNTSSVGYPNQFILSNSENIIFKSILAPGIGGNGGISNGTQSCSCAAQTSQTFQTNFNSSVYNGGYGGGSGPPSQITATEALFNNGYNTLNVLGEPIPTYTFIPNYNYPNYTYSLNFCSGGSGGSSSAGFLVAYESSTTSGFNSNATSNTSESDIPYNDGRANNPNIVPNASFSGYVNRLSYATGSSILISPGTSTSSQSGIINTPLVQNTVGGYYVYTPIFSGYNAPGGCVSQATSLQGGTLGFNSCNSKNQIIALTAGMGSGGGGGGGQPTQVSGYYINQTPAGGGTGMAGGLLLYISKNSVIPN